MLKTHSTVNNTFENEHKYYLNYAVIIAVILGLVSQVLSYYFDYNFAYRDSIYRLEAARRFFDAYNPGLISQIGTVWLPIPNLLLMPFAYVDILWQTGLAAAIMNFPLFVISAAVVFLSIKKLTNNVIATWFGFLVYVLNYNILYFQTTSMTEQLYLTLIICSFYFLHLWADGKKLKHLLWSSFFISLGVGSRYDAWPVAIVSIVIVFIVSILDKEKPIRNSFIYGFIPVLLIIVWFWYNWLFYGDALEFSRGRFSTLYQLQYYEAAGRLLTKHNFLLSTKVYLSSVLIYSGNLYAVLAVLALFFYAFKNRLNSKYLPVYVLWVALPVSLILLYKGQVIIELPNSEPAGYFNSRYGLYMFPAIAIFSGIFAFYIQRYIKKKILIYLFAIGLLVQQLTFLYNFPYSIPSLAEAKYSYSKASEDLSLFLKENYKGGGILYDNVVFAIHPWTGINLAERITFHTSEIGEKAMKEPSKYVNWVMFYKESPNDHIHDAVKNNPDFLNNFILRFSTSGVEVYSKK
ncbi:MAG: hypothetical protein WC139_02820 [Candidatus Kapaibacterium sp.]